MIGYSDAIEVNLTARSAAAPEVNLTAPPPEVRHSCCRDAAPEKMLPMESSKL